MKPQPESQTAIPGAFQHRWGMLVLLLTGQLMGLIDVLVVNVAAPDISRDLNTTGTALQLIVGSYVVAYAVLLITGARLGAMFGNKPVFLTGLALFTVASFACGLAPTVPLLVVARVVQGAGAAAMIPQVMSLIQTQFQGRDRAKALSAYGVVLAAGATVGLVVGGLLVAANLFDLHWRPVFFVNVPIGIVLLAIAPRLLPSSGARAPSRMDVAGLALGVISVLLVIAPLVFGTAYEWPLWLIAGIPAGLVMGWIFARYETRLAQRRGRPLLNFTVFRAGGFASGLSTLAFLQVAYGGFLFVFTLYLELVLQFSALVVAAIYLPMSIAFGVSGFFWRKIPARLQPYIAPVGMAICALGYLWSTAAIGAGDPGASLAIGLAVLGLGLGLSASPVITQSLQAVEPHQAADASGALTTTVQLCQAIGIAVVGALYFAVVQPQAQSVATAGTPSLLMPIGGALAIVSVLGALVSLPLVRRLHEDL